MMSKLGAMFVLLLLFTLASSQEKGDVQAGKTQKSDFYRTLTRSARGCTMSCAFQNNICQGTCHCSGTSFFSMTPSLLQATCTVTVFLDTPLL
uniref:Conotoxin Superfamily S n=1 Tax=Conus episcopatus TaxID=88764 RepID=A0A0K2S6S7_CONEP|nr:Conotoxin Superfamily S [Conus episcopatus]